MLTYSPQKTPAKSMVMICMPAISLPAPAQYLIAYK